MSAELMGLHRLGQRPSALRRNLSPMVHAAAWFTAALVTIAVAAYLFATAPRR